MRPIRITDAPRFVKWLSDEEVRKLLAANPKKPTLKEEKKWIRSLSKKGNKDINFAIDVGSIHIGSLGLRMNLNNKNANFGILIGDKKYWGSGYGFDSSKLIIDYGFKKLRLHKIYLGVYSYNPRAINLYKKIGFKIEGVQKEQVYWKNKFYDDINMGFLRSEWVKKNKR